MGRNQFYKNGGKSFQSGDLILKRKNERQKRNKGGKSGHYVSFGTVQKMMEQERQKD